MMDMNEHSDYNNEYVGWLDILKGILLFGIYSHLTKQFENL